MAPPPVAPKTQCLRNPRFNFCLGSTEVITGSAATTATAIEAKRNQSLAIDPQELALDCSRLELAQIDAQQVSFLCGERSGAITRISLTGSLVVEDFEKHHFQSSHN